MVKRLVQYLKGYVFFIFVILVFALINVVTTLLIPVLIGNAIDCIIDFNNVNFEQINKILFFIFLCILVGNIFDASLEQEMMEELSSYRMIYQIVYMFLSGGFISSIYVFIYIFKKGILRFQWWFIFWISFAVSILTIICSILLLGLYGYAFYKGVIKKGKNH